MKQHSDPGRLLWAAAVLRELSGRDGCGKGPLWSSWLDAVPQPLYVGSWRESRA